MRIFFDFGYQSYKVAVCIKNSAVSFDMRFPLWANRLPIQPISELLLYGYYNLYFSSIVSVKLSALIGFKLNGIIDKHRQQ